MRRRVYETRGISLAHECIVREELRPQRLDDLLGTVDSSPGTALPSESRFIGVPVAG